MLNFGVGTTDKFSRPVYRLTVLVGSIPSLSSSPAPAK
jgi:hypothetical protein